ncbi:MAG TPA: hypothetical protein VEC12_05270 [Bacteroidia bacterium]|nr:hypothetical protein [Bacteroidia bacterium]
MKHIVIILSLMSLTLFSCKKEKDETVWYRYMETQCSNPFTVETDPAVTRQHLDSFLNNNGIDPLSIESKPHGTLCALQVCTCPKAKGYYHYVRVHERDSKTLEELAFTRNNP